MTSQFTSRDWINFVMTNGTIGVLDRQGVPNEYTEQQLISRTQSINKWSLCCDVIPNTQPFVVRYHRFNLIRVFFDNAPPVHAAPCSCVV